MNQVKVIESRGYILTHNWSLDDFGLQKNHFEISRIREDGMEMIYPFIGNLRVANVDRSTAFFGDNVLPYEEWEYLEMINKQVDLISSLDKPKYSEKAEDINPKE